MPNDFDYTFIGVPGPDCNNNPTIEQCTGTFNVEAFTDAIKTRAFPSGNHPHWAGEPYYLNYPPILWNLVFSSESNKTALYLEIQNILNGFFDWSIVGPLLQERKNRLHQAIVTTNAAITRPVSLGGGTGCEDVYNPEEIEGDETGFCNPSRASIKRFIDERRIILQQEINEN